MRAGVPWRQAETQLEDFKLREAEGSPRTRVLPIPDHVVCDVSSASSLSGVATTTYAANRLNWVGSLPLLVSKGILKLFGLPYLDAKFVAEVSGKLELVNEAHAVLHLDNDGISVLDR